MHLKNKCTKGPTIQGVMVDLSTPGRQPTNRGVIVDCTIPGRNPTNQGVVVDCTTFYILLEWQFPYTL